MIEGGATPLGQLSPALLVVVVVLCAWAYPELNAWVYRRRILRDDARAARPGDGERADLAGRATQE